MAQVKTDRLRRILYTVAICCNIASADASPVSKKRTDLTQSQMIENLIQSNFGKASKNTIITDRKTADLKFIISNGLNPNLLDGLETLSGKDYAIRSDGNTDVQLGSVIIGYKTSEIAKAKAKTACKKGAYFQHTKILTPFTAAALKNDLIIVFTEQALNEKALHVLQSMGHHYRVTPSTGCIAKSIQQPQGTP
jgi:hypothetical protein